MVLIYEFKNLKCKKKFYRILNLNPIYVAIMNKKHHNKKKKNCNRYHSFLFKVN
jgi:hypothetical protein